jgi:DHA1 family chloramphenicol resistance protein-like MFS transporter
MVAGGPAGTLLSHFTQWRGGFWAVVVLTVLGAAGCRFGLRPARAVSSGPAPNVSSELRGLRRPSLWVLYGITILTTAAYMITFNYLSAMLSTITKLSEGWIPAVLALFGVGAFIGLSIGGRIADRRPRAALLVGALGITALSLVMIVAIRYIWAAVPTVLLLGVVAFVLNPAIYGRVFTVAAVAPTLAGATTVSAFQFGISITPVLAAVPLDHGGSLTSVCIIGAVLSAAAACLIIPMDSSKPDI